MSENRRTILASAGALSAAIAACGCCVPLLPFVTAAGLAGGAAFLTTLQPYFLGTSVILIAYGFYQARRTKQCNRRPSAASTVVLWISATIVVMMVLFPQAVASLLAG